MTKDAAEAIEIAAVLHPPGRVGMPEIVEAEVPAPPAALAAASEAEWSIFNLEAPDMPRSSIDVVPRRSVTSVNLPEVCADFRELHPDTFIVSNKVKMIADTMPPVTARGSNDLIGKNVMQTMTFMPPELYEVLQVLNAWTGRTDLVGMHHIDEANQTAGRNLGFRHQEGVSHTLLINRSLLQILVRSSAVGRLRYIWRPVLTSISVPMRTTIVGDCGAGTDPARWSRRWVVSTEVGFLDRSY